MQKGPSAEAWGGEKQISEQLWELLTHADGQGGTQFYILFKNKI